jgi:general stress protein YciG
MTKQQAGAIGGRRTFEKHGKSHMQQIGRAGAKVTWTRYTMKPINQSQYAMVDRATNVIKAMIGVWKP